MAFRVRDLMINIIQDRIGGEGEGCGDDTLDPTDPNCDGDFSCFATCDGTWQCGWTPPVNPCGPTYQCVGFTPCFFYTCPPADPSSAPLHPFPARSARPDFR